MYHRKPYSNPIIVFTFLKKSLIKIPILLFSPCRTGNFHYHKEWWWERGGGAQILSKKKWKNCLEIFLVKEISPWAGGVWTVDSTRDPVVRVLKLEGFTKNDRTELILQVFLFAINTPIFYKKKKL